MRASERPTRGSHASKHQKGGENESVGFGLEGGGEEEAKVGHGKVGEEEVGGDEPGGAAHELDHDAAAGEEEASDGERAGELPADGEAGGQIGAQKRAQSVGQPREHEMAGREQRQRGPYGVHGAHVDSSGRRHEDSAQVDQRHVQHTPCQKATSS